MKVTWRFKLGIHYLACHRECGWVQTQCWALTRAGHHTLPWTRLRILETNSCSCKFCVEPVLAFRRFIGTAACGEAPMSIGTRIAITVSFCSNLHGVIKQYYSSRHHIACFKAMERDFALPYHAARSHQYSVTSFATPRVLSRLHSSGLRWPCGNVVRFWCDLEACTLETATLASTYGQLGI
jgi:hypothetical protein